MADEFQTLADRQAETSAALRRLVDTLNQTAVSTRAEGLHTAPRAPETTVGGPRPIDGTAVRNLDQSLRSLTRSAGGVDRSLGANTRALDATAKAFTGGVQGLLSGLAGGLRQGGGVASVLRGGLGVAPLASAIAGLFRRRTKEPELISPVETLPRFDLSLANSAGPLPGATRVVRGQHEEVRTAPSEARAPAQVVVNVNAMDSRSFLDRSDDIARAVRDAMLHMHPVNDVISEL